MSEKRKPELVFFAEYRGKSRSTRKRLLKIELFPARQWKPTATVGAGRQSGLMLHETRGDVYRVRVNGKWYPPKGTTTRKVTLTLSEFFALFRCSVKQARTVLRNKDRQLQRKKSNG